MSTPRPATLALVFALLAACGTEIGNPKKPKDGSTPAPQPTSVISDTGVDADLIASQADEVIAAAAEDAQNANLSLALVGSTPQFTSTCTANADGTASVQKGADGQENESFTAHGQPASVAAQILSSQQYTWTLPSGPLKCDAANDNLALDWTAADGLTLAETINSTTTTTITRTGPNGPVSHTGTAEVSGTRNVVWHRDAPSDTSAAFALSKTVTSALDKTVTSTRHGQQISVASHISVTAGAPVQIEILRDKTTQAWVSKTIVSGTVSSLQDEGSHVDSTYGNLQFTSGSGCVPDSGTITGALFASGATTPTHSFTVSFAQGAATITFDDGTQAPYVPAFCALD